MGRGDSIPSGSCGWSKYLKWFISPTECCCLCPFRRSPVGSQGQSYASLGSRSRTSAWLHGTRTYIPGWPCSCLLIPIGVCEHYHILPAGSLSDHMWCQSRHKHKQHCSDSTWARGQLVHLACTQWDPQLCIVVYCVCIDRKYFYFIRTVNSYYWSACIQCCSKSMVLSIMTVLFTSDIHQ